MSPETSRIAEEGDTDAAIKYLQETVPNLPPNFGTDPDVHIFEAVPHTQAQEIIMAAMNLAVDLDRGAFTESTTVADLIAWLEQSAMIWLANRTHVVGRPRGSYATSAATLRPIIDSDLNLAYLASLEPKNSHRWRYRGQTPSPEDFKRSVFAPGILAQFAVVPATGAVTPAVGMVSAYDADLTNGYASVAFQRFHTHSETVKLNAQPVRGLMIEGLLIFFQYLFDHFTFRKLYLEIPEYNISLFGESARDILIEEGRLKGHYYYGDRYWDLCIHALYRDRWDQVAESFRGPWTTS